MQKVREVFEEATLPMPGECFMQTGGKTCMHTEFMGFILAEMQSLQRTIPGAEW
jgi:ring-1,2-phenylacetyl-CoA epoxidase subunit PaaC